jgi:hypothetical protein
MFALNDADSFYCSCERAFDPVLRGKPLAVISNNDGAPSPAREKLKRLTKFLCPNATASSVIVQSYVTEAQR